MLGYLGHHCEFAGSALAGSLEAVVRNQSQAQSLGTPAGMQVNNCLDRLNVHTSDVL